MSLQGRTKETRSHHNLKGEGVCVRLVACDKLREVSEARFFGSAVRGIYVRLIRQHTWLRGVVYTVIVNRVGEVSRSEFLP